MILKALKQILKGFSDDTRLRIMNLLSYRELRVNEICKVLEVSQPSVSKHLVRLRLLKIVNDRREGNCIYYSPSNDPIMMRLRDIFISEFKDIEEFKRDRERLDEIQNTGVSSES